MPMYIFYRSVLYYSTCNLFCSLIRNFILCANIVSVAGHSSSFACVVDFLGHPTCGMTFSSGLMKFYVIDSIRW